VEESPAEDPALHPNAQLLKTFYTAFQRRDAEAMAACYHPDVEFSDPVFPELRGEQAGAMWRMLCERGKDLVIEFRDVNADDATGSAHWDARYTFGATGRKVLNRIEARFDFEDGLIRRHRDRFDLWRWAGQALGLKGRLLGWAGPVQQAIRRQAATALERYTAAQGSTA
jgi:ketosteroid isomerase-like protein